jgi:hypothetical protein
LREQSGMKAHATGLNATFPVQPPQAGKATLEKTSYTRATKV